MKALVGAFNQEKALVGAFSVITNLRMELFQALVLDGERVVEGIAAPLVLGAVALETVDVVASWQYSHYLFKTNHFTFNSTSLSKTIIYPADV